MLFRPKEKKGGYTFKIDQERYVLPSFVWIELEGNKLRFYNRFTGVYHLFEDGSSVKELNIRTLNSLKKKIEEGMECADEFRRRGTKTD